MTIDMKIGGGITTSQMGQSTVLSCHGSLTFQICDSGALEKRLNSEVVVDFDIDKSLIGGLKIAYEDQVLDMSIKRKLDLLQTQLRN